MKEHPIIFTPENARANREGRKTQTRRVVKSQPETNHGKIGDVFYAQSSGYLATNIPAAGGYKTVPLRCPHGRPGDLLWQKEKWRGRALAGTRFRCELAAGGDFEIDTVDDCQFWRPILRKAVREYPKWQPSMFMPRELSTTTLRVTDTRVERVQEISSDDAVAEGATGRRLQGPYGEYTGWSMDWSRVGSRSRFAGGIHPRGEEQPLTESEVALGSPQAAFGNLWDSINAKRGHGWEKNDWVWAISYELVKGAR